MKADSTSSMVERVARAICRAEYRSEIESGTLILSGPNGEDLAPAAALDQYVDRMWEGFVLHAHAAIEAMREPTQAMLALHDGMAGNELCWDANAETLSQVWQAMIDAALTAPCESGS